jgi:hypothetical protein
MTERNSTVIVVGFLFSLLAAVVCGCLGLWGPFAIWMVIAFIVLPAIAGTAKQPPKRHVSRNYW